ncbi:MAG: glycogen synthase GlgA [Clostridiales bacterium]|nr:glycogen synthase GlgA [Clostridiales bacterium]
MKRKVLFAASEALPYASTGGLGDVAASLPKALSQNGTDVRIVLPLYDTISQNLRAGLRFLGSINVPLSWRNQYCGIFEGNIEGVTYYLIDNEYYFRRGTLYGCYDDGERYAFFCKAVLEILPFIDFFPDVLHAHDWQAALSVVYLKLHYSGLARYNHIKAVFTIHNIEYQGIFGLGILSDVFELAPWERNIVEWHGDINLMKGAIECCDRLTTVSPRYADEIKSPEFAHRLDPILRDKQYKTQGIVNGIDTVYYNPAKDPDLAAKYSHKTLAGKADNKRILQQALALPELADVPLIAMITRLTPHKGIDLVKRIIDEFLNDDIQFILLGTGDAEYEAFFRDLEARRHDKARCIIQFDKKLSKRIYAAADLFLMPSRAEPCGLSQMIASAYGAVPVVREVGGLYDSIKSYNEFTGEGNGFTFANYNAHDMLYTLRRAVGYYHDQVFWRSFVQKIMTIDFSWKTSSVKYSQLYDKLCL